ncbi:phytanoyl-CoA dioxygenase family protein [Paenibacillus mendelii]|uniref:Phytanoyl-CoA dioxygenase family protein n=1 Tax=Paenibacillus mendelii TaxID=206163 RepID=A0ABV6JFN4_9BACL|nr:phytanoyl-CoA dioxygenase family protein [Paenibacillus mendelii]MCQ6557392.1 phytanoyl-CoA dioxygenase family protein [Paenibacillus mendelii]
MNEIEQYEFDRSGYLIIKNLITPEQVAAIAEVVDRLEAHAAEHVHLPPRKQSCWGSEHHYNEELSYHAYGEQAIGKTLVIEDFFNTDPVFDCLVDHEPTMAYIRRIVQGPIRINNSEIRIRYTGNASGTHMGGPIDHKYRYNFNQNGIDCMMVRMVYFLQPVTNDQGAFCVVPGTHKTNWRSPYGSNPDAEPGMIGLEVEAGDAILFTEHLRHGGLTNHSEQTRKTLHVGYGPAWMMSQNIATMDEPQFITDTALSRYTEAQRKLFRIM